MVAPLFFLFGLAACGLPIALHFLRPKPRQIFPFPTLKFLQQAVVRNNPRHNLMRWLVLALRCLAFLLLGFAFARPLLHQEITHQDEAVVFVVDTSFSMQAHQRYQKILDWALAEVRNVDERASSGLLLMQPVPRWQVPFGARLTDVKAQLKNLEVGYGESEYRTALRLAGERLRESPASIRKIVLLGDHQHLGWQTVDFSEPLPPGVDLVFPQVPSPPLSHLAVTDLRIVRRAKGRRAQVSVTPHALTQPTHDLELLVDGKSFGTKTLQLLVGQPVRVTFDLPPDEEPRWLEARLQSDDLTPDNSVFTVLRQKSMNLQLSPVESGVDYLRIAAEIHPGDDGHAFQVVDWPEQEWPTDTIALLRGDLCFQKEEVDELERFLSGGGRAILFYSGSSAQKNWLRQQGLTTTPITADEIPLRLQDWDLTHPSLAPFTDSDISPLLQLQFREGHRFSSNQVWPIARWPDRSVAVAEASVLGGTLFLAGFEPRPESSLVRSASFLPLVHGAARWLAGETDAPELLQVGDVIDLPSAGRWEALTGPDPADRFVAQGPLTVDTPGVFRFTSEEGGKTLYAVNVSTRESDLRAWTNPDDFDLLQNPIATRPSAVSETVPSQRSTLSWWLLVILFFLLLPEILLSNRTAR